MIASKSNPLTLQSNLGGSDHKMGIDAAAMAHIMNVLTDLYSDPELAVIREYSTNAWDAHVEISNKQPIEVTLPNMLTPFFVVRDFGVGLSEQDIAAIYSQYGASTKRGTNSQVGMLGLGCKSALTYVQQFTITSVKDGEQVQVAVTREADGGSMRVVDKRPTDALNGTTVQIPAKKDHTAYDSFKQKAMEFFSYWPEGHVLVNGEKPPRVDGLWLGDSILVKPNGEGRYSRPTTKIVMGNVAYPVEETRLNMTRLVAPGHDVVFFVKIGEVNFVPAREGLNYDDHTKATLTRLSADFTAAAKGAIQREVDKATSKPEALANLLKAREALANASAYGSFKFQGQPMFEKWTLPHSGHYHPPISGRILQVPRESYVANRAETRREVTPDSLNGAVIVHDYEGKKFSAPQKKKLLKLVEEKGWDNDAIGKPQRFILLCNKPGADLTAWVPKDRVVSWTDVNKIKLPQHQTASYGSTKQIQGSYENVIVDGNDVGEVPAAKIDTSRPLYTHEGAWHSSRAFAVALKQAGVTSFTLVPLPSNRRDKFMRLFPNAVPVKDALRAKAQEWAKNLTEDERIVMMIHGKHGIEDTLRVLDPAKVDDPALQRAIRLSKMNGDKLLQKRRQFESVVGSLDIGDVKWENPLDRYPLVDVDHGYYSRGDKATRMKHNYLYVNAAYAAR